MTFAQDERRPLDRLQPRQRPVEIEPVADRRRVGGREIERRGVALAPLASLPARMVDEAAPPDRAEPR